jgi:hypothetical protein
MARILAALPAALEAVNNGMSANAFDKQLRELGMGARRSEVLALYKAASGILARAPSEPFQDIRLNPAANPLPEWPTSKATGIHQTVALLYRDRTTGAILQTYWGTSSELGITREEAMATALNAYSDHAEEYNQDLIGAVHIASYQNVPMARAA